MKLTIYNGDAWLAAHNSDPDLADRIDANESAPYVSAGWLAAREYYRSGGKLPVIARCHYCGATPAEKHICETEPICAKCARPWDREPKEIDDDDN